METDEVYITAGHKGHPEVVARLGRKRRRRKLRGKRGRGTLEGEKPPVFGMLQRSGEVVIQMVANMQHVTIKPLITKTISPGSLIYTDEYEIYDSLPAWGYHHKSVNHAAGEFAASGTSPTLCTHPERVAPQGNLVRTSRLDFLTRQFSPRVQPAPSPKLAYPGPFA